MLSLVAVTLSFVACHPPGQKFTTVPERGQTTVVEMGGMQVTLKPLNAEIIQAQSLPSAGSGDLMDLLVAKPPPYRVGPQDVLLVTVWDHPELSLPLGQFRTDAASGSLVDEDGCMYFPFVGRLPVAGLTVPEVRTKLTAALEKSLRNPQLDVKVLLYRSQRVFVSGEVKVPAVYSVTDVPFTLAEAANRAGGFLPAADLARVTIARGDRHWTLNFLGLLTEGSRFGQILLQDGDILHVHHRDEAPVYLMGELRNPRSVPLYNGQLSLAQAISEAGGINTGSADARSIYVLRKGSASREVQVFHLDAFNPVAMVLADRFAMQPRDLVYVDAGSLVRWNRILGLLIPTVSAVTSTAAEVKFLSK